MALAPVRQPNECSQELSWARSVPRCGALQPTDKAVNYNGYPIQSVDHPVVIVILATQDISEVKVLHWKVLFFMVCIGMYRNWQPDGSAVQPPLCLRLKWHIPCTPMHLNTCKCVQIRTSTDEYRSKAGPGARAPSQRNWSSAPGHGPGSRNQRTFVWNVLLIPVSVLFSVARRGSCNGTGLRLAGPGPPTAALPKANLNFQVNYTWCSSS